MRLSVCVLISALALVGCARAPLLSSPLEEPGDRYSGKVASLADLLKNKTEAYVVFVHGVGDHCPGYALSPDFGWLSLKETTAMRLSAIGSPKVTNIFDSEFMPNRSLDSASLVSFTALDYKYRPDPSTGPSITVHAIEITWSQLTQWVKTNKLGYDLTKPVDAIPSLDCRCPYKSTVRYKAPPAREKLNRLLKENTFDRSLVDAILYTGVYGKVMRRGLAEALCRGLGGQKNTDGKLCTWPTHSSDTAAYFFVTHSLGSRILYDTLNGLKGNDVTPTAETFTPDEQVDADSFINQIVIQTNAIYMMANQLPLLGLAYEEGSSSTDPPRPLIRIRSSDTGGGNLLQKNHPQLSINRFIDLRARIALEKNKPVDKLTVVAFSDPNDLLSWSIPKWYQQLPDGKEPFATYTNVYLQNSTHWFGFVENPAAAHTGYFVNKDVWRVIRCGSGKDGHVKQCK
jgi:hypothetical protein